MTPNNNIAKSTSPHLSPKSNRPEAFYRLGFANVSRGGLIIFACLLMLASPTFGQATQENSQTNEQPQVQPNQTTARNPGWAKPLHAAGVDNFYQVNDWLYRSAQPDAEGFKNLEAMGIKTVINLRDTNKDPKAAAGTTLILVNPSITTWSFTDAEVINALRAINQAERPVLVHCRHGADRTGLIIALTRVINEGWSVEDAKEEMLNGGYGFHSIWKNIPEYLDTVNIETLKAQVPAANAY